MTIPIPLCPRCGWHREDCTCGRQRDEVQRRRERARVARVARAHRDAVQRAAGLTSAQWRAA